MMQRIIQGDRMNLFNIEGKKAIVTGGSKGLGYGMAEGLLESGCEVAIIGSSAKIFESAAAFSEKGCKCYGIKANLIDRQENYRAFEECLAALGGDVDILVTAAGIQRRHSAEDFPLEEWDEVLNINLNSVFIMCQLAGRVMLKKGHAGRLSMWLPCFPSLAARQFRRTPQPRAAWRSLRRRSPTTGWEEESMSTPSLPAIWQPI